MINSALLRDYSPKEGPFRNSSKKGGGEMGLRFLCVPYLSEVNGAKKHQKGLNGKRETESFVIGLEC